MKQTKADKIIEYLKAKGCIEIQSRSGKYRQLKRPNKTDYYFVGKNGALRVGSCASKSVSLTHLVKI